MQVYRDAPETALVGFAKVRLEPGESRRVTIPLPRRRFMTWTGAGWTQIAPTLPVRIACSAEDEGRVLELTVASLADDGI